MKYITILLLFLTACTPFADFSVIEMSSSEVIINSDTFKSHNFLPLTTNESQKKITVNNVPAGRIWDFGLITNSNQTQLICTPKDSVSAPVYYISNNNIHIDIGPRIAAGKIEFDCQAGKTQFLFEVNYTANKLGVISSNITKSSQNFESDEQLQIADNGKKVLFVSDGQIYIKDLVANQINLVSSTDGTAAHQGNAPSSSAHMSEDGRKVVFTSKATNLIPGTTGTQVFLKDLSTGSITLVSSNDSSVANQANNSNAKPFISSDGTKVVFQSNATNLVNGSSGQQVFLKNLVDNTISVISSGPNGQGNNSSSSAKISSNGRFIVFTSLATNLLIAPTSGQHIFRKDLNTNTIQLVSSIDSSSTVSGNAASDNADISSDGQLIVFQSQSTNLTTTPAVTSNKQIFLKNMNDLKVQLISSSDINFSIQGDGVSVDPDISEDGQSVIFQSVSTNLIPGSTGQQIYAKNISSGNIKLISSLDGSIAKKGNDASYYAKLSSNGRKIIFGSTSSNLGGSIGYVIYIKNLDDESLIAINRIQSQSTNQGNSISYYPQFSADNKKVVFYSWSSNLVDGQDSWNYQVYIKDLTSGVVRLVSERNGVAGNGFSTYPRITPDGKKVVFISTATNLVPGVTGTLQHIYLKDMDSGTVTLISSTDGTVSGIADNSSYTPSISDDGSKIAFYSLATNLVSPAMTGYQAYLKDLNTNTIKHISYAQDGTSPANQGYNQNFHAEVSPNGQKVIYTASASNQWPSINFTQIYIRDVATGSLRIVSSTNGMGSGRGGNNSYAPRFSGDGTKVVFHSYGGFSGCTVANAQVYLKDLATEAITPVSRINDSSCFSNIRGNGHSYNATTNFDGTKIVFQSRATNLIPGTVLPAGSNNTHILLKDMTNQNLTMISSTDGTINTQGNQDSYYPFISSDATKIIFDSASDNFITNIKGRQIYIYDNQ